MYSCRVDKSSARKSDLVDLPTIAGSFSWVILKIIAKTMRAEYSSLPLAGQSSTA